MSALQGMASTDGRTGLANSRSFDEMLQDRLTTRDAGDELAVLMLDIDHFKDFNDRNGHPAGDEALRTFARVLQSAIRDGDVPARYGGEEFVVMLPGARQLRSRRRGGADPHAGRGDRRSTSRPAIATRSRCRSGSPCGRRTRTTG